MSKLYLLWNEYKSSQYKNIKPLESYIEGGLQDSENDFLFFLMNDISVSHEKDIIPIVKAMIKKNKNCVHITDTNGHTPLILACTKKLLKICDILIDNEAKVTDEIKGSTALHYLAEYKNMEILKNDTYKDYIKIITKIDAKCPQAKYIKDTRCGDTPLHLSVWSQNLEGSKTLLFLDSNINITNTKNNQPPLYYARNKDLQMTLLSMGADPDIGDCWDKLNMVKLLKDKQLNIGLKLKFVNLLCNDKGLLRKFNHKFNDALDVLYKNLQDCDYVLSGYIRNINNNDNDILQYDDIISIVVAYYNGITVSFYNQYKYLWQIIDEQNTVNLIDKCINSIKQQETIDINNININQDSAEVMNLLLTIFPSYCVPQLQKQLNNDIINYNYNLVALVKKYVSYAVNYDVNILLPLLSCNNNKNILIDDTLGIQEIYKFLIRISSEYVMPQHQLYDNEKDEICIDDIIKMKHINILIIAFENVYRSMINDLHTINKEQFWYYDNFYKPISLGISKKIDILPDQDLITYIFSFLSQTDVPNTNLNLFQLRNIMNAIQSEYTSEKCNSIVKDLISKLANKINPQQTTFSKDQALKLINSLESYIYKMLVTISENINNGKQISDIDIAQKLKAPDIQGKIEQLLDLDNMSFNSGNSNFIKNGIDVISYIEDAGFIFENDIHFSL